MKPYRDSYGNKLSQRDVRAATELITRTKKPTTMLLSRYLQFGPKKAQQIIQLLQDANVVGQDEQGNRFVVLRGDAAINAALRQLKKGKS